MGSAMEVNMGKPEKKNLFESAKYMRRLGGVLPSRNIELNYGVTKSPDLNAKNLLCQNMNNFFYLWKTLCNYSCNSQICTILYGPIT